ncbi:hypothetical protein ACR76M_01150 [Enterococcus innesii]|uniref:hypothetical protein n=1 Tax=Enterococcus innesii TaxID=2839759 RepID=UPI003DA684A6
MKKYKLFYFNHTKNNVLYDEFEIPNFPSVCCHCNKTGLQEFLTGSVDYFDENNQLSEISLITMCHACNERSINVLSVSIDAYLNHFASKIIETIPRKTFTLKVIPESIKKLSSEFENIYAEADTAYKTGLNHLAGMGFRKSVEFLLTDYLLETYKDDEDKIKSIKNPKTSMITKIKMLNKERLETLATASAWIGNDETHYSRRHLDFSVEDLIAFINAFVSEIENDIVYANAEELILKNKKK